MSWFQFSINYILLVTNLSHNIGCRYTRIWCGAQGYDFPHQNAKAPDVGFYGEYIVVKWLCSHPSLRVRRGYLMGYPVLSKPYLIGSFPSLFLSYIFEVMTSLAKPKSATLQVWSSEMRILRAARSRWIICNRLLIKVFYETSNNSTYSPWC